MALNNIPVPISSYIIDQAAITAGMKHGCSAQSCNRILNEMTRRGGRREAGKYVQVLEMLPSVSQVSEKAKRTVDDSSAQRREIPRHLKVDRV